jgi:hypothetical protein
MSWHCTRGGGKEEDKRKCYFSALIGNIGRRRGEERRKEEYSRTEAYVNIRREYKYVL